jgi:hypothetical protein
MEWIYVAFIVSVALALLDCAINVTHLRPTLGVVVLATALLLPATAVASDFTTTQVDEITEHVHRGGTPYTAPRNPSVGCGSVCENLLSAERRPLPAEPARRTLTERLSALLFRLRGRVGVLPKVATLASRLTIVGGTAVVVIRVVGHEFGDNVYEFEIPLSPGEFTGVSLVQAGQTLVAAGEASVVAPEDGWRPEYGAQLPYSYEYVIDDPGTFLTDPPCIGHHNPSPPPTWGGWSNLGGPVFGRGIDCGAVTGQYVVPFQPLLLKRAEPYDPSNPAHNPTAGTFGPEIYDPPQTGTELRGRIETELEANLDYGLLIRWYQHQFDPENYPDPTTTEGEDHRCDLGAPTYENPDGSTNPAPHAHKISIPFAVSVRPSGAQGDPEPYLRFGKANWQDRSPATSYIDDWDGWGWRHIRAKHGWSPADEAATRQTLMAPAHTAEQMATSMRYIGAEYEQHGAVCERWVVVEYGVHESDPPGAPKGIITSYGKFIRNAS